ncbi:MAG: type II toxin-antitoxin system VapC family toxin [Desulfobacterales bacterium]|jgi:predicted nucleic-acid-binding protein
MKALDTNVLVRFLVKDDERQSEIVYRTFKKAETDKNTFFVPLLVVLETLWVLDSVYKIARNGILDSINEVLLMPILKFEAQETIQRFIFLARENKIDLSDILIACSARLAGCESVLTFDKKASKFEYFELIDPN